MSESKQSKPWYKTVWGIILIIFLFPILVPYLIWTKTKWNKWVKIGVIAFIFIALIMGSISENQDRKEAAALANQAEMLITENKVDKALNKINDSQQLNSDKENPAFALEEKIMKFKSEAFLKEILTEMSNDDFNLLKNGELKTTFINHEKLNNLFVAKLKENAENRAIYLAEIEEQKRREKAEAERIRKEEAAAKRKSMIEEQFSAWDGSHRNLTKVIKKAMNDPDSYEHVETVYWDMKDHLVVRTTFRGKNAFGGVVKNIIKAKVSLDGDVLEILEQY